MPRGTTLRVVAAAVLLVIATGCSGGGIDDLKPPATSTTAEQLAPTITTAAPFTGQALVVEDQGVTSFTDPYDKAAVLGGYAVIVRNPDPTLMAAGVRVRTAILDAAGTQLLVDTAVLNGIMPGARMAVGRTLIEDVRGPTTLQVSIDVTEWQPPAFTQLLVPDVVNTDVDVYGGAATRFAVRSTLPVPEQGVDVTAVYRDKDGRLLAGESTTLNEVAPGATVLGQISLIAPIPGAATTEVFVGRGFAAQTVG